MLLTPNTLVQTAGTSTSSKPASPPSVPKLPGPLSVLKSVVQTSGLKGLWLGQTGTLIRETGGGVAWFVSKEAVARLLLSRRPPTPEGQPRPHLAAWESAVSGACAGLAYNVALFPADTVKSAVQTEAEMRPRAPGEPYPSFVATARAMYKAQGLKGLYAGCGITAARAVPSSALIFIIYDGLTRRFG
jgi:mitochondrial ornithine carrier protein